MDAENVGAIVVRPQDIVAAAKFPGGYGIRPYGVGVDACIDPKTSRLLPRCAGDQWSPLQGGYSVVVSDEDDAIPDVSSVEVGSKAGRVSL